MDVNSPEKSESYYSDVIVAGNTLWPLFLVSPHDESVAVFYDTLTHQLSEVAQTWPFGSSDEVKAAFDLMGEGLRNGVDQALVEEYQRLFVGPHHLNVAPWGSVYTDYDGVCFGETTIALSRWLKKNGIAFSLQSKEAVDHIGIMLSLMAYIAQFNAQLLDEFLEQHFLPWVYHYAELLCNEAKHPFYKGLARLLSVTMKDIQFVGDLTPAQVRLYR